MFTDGGAEESPPAATGGLKNQPISLPLAHAPAARIAEQPVGIQMICGERLGSAIGEEFQQYADVKAQSGAAP